MHGNVQQRPGRLVAAHNGILGRGPGENETRIEGFAAESVIAGAERTAQDHGDLRHHAVGNDVDELGPGLDDTGLLGILADHEAVHVL